MISCTTYINIRPAVEPAFVLTLFLIRTRHIWWKVGVGKDINCGSTASTVKHSDLFLIKCNLEIEILEVMLQWMLLWSVKLSSKTLKTEHGVGLAWVCSGLSFSCIKPLRSTGILTTPKTNKTSWVNEGWTNSRAPEPENSRSENRDKQEFDLGIY